MASADPGLTIIIPTWNGCGLLRRCLTSLQRQTETARIIVVDNGSDDGTIEMLQRDFPQVTCHHLESNQGFARAVNEGIRRVQTRWLALLNNDTEADPGWVAAGRHALEYSPGFDFFACRLINYHHRDRLDSAGDCYNRFGMPYKRGWGKPRDSFSRREPVLAASAGAAFYRLSLFREVGLLDEDFHIYLEDVEFSLRCQLLGRRCLYLPEAVVYHHEAASDPDLRESEPATPAPAVAYSTNRVFWISRNRWLLMVLYQPVRNLPFLLWGWARSTLFHLMKAGFFGAFVRGLASGWTLTPRFLLKRLRLRRRRRLTSGEVCRLLQQC